MYRHRVPLSLFRVRSHCAELHFCPLFCRGNISPGRSLISMAIDLSELEEEYEKYINTPSYENMTLKPPASCSPATYPQTGSSMLSVCPTGLAALDCRALLNTSVGEIVCSPVALSHGFGSKSWPIASSLC